MSEDDSEATASPDSPVGTAKVKRRLAERTVLFGFVVLLLMMLVPVFLMLLVPLLSDSSSSAAGYVDATLWVKLFGVLGGLCAILGIYFNASRHFSRRIFAIARDAESLERLKRDFPWGFSSLAATACSLLAIQAISVNSAYVAPRPAQEGQVWLAASGLQIGWNSDLDGIELINVEKDADRKIASLRSPPMLTKILAAQPLIASYLRDAPIEYLAGKLDISRFEDTNRYLVSMELSDTITDQKAFQQLVEQFLEELKQDEMAKYTELHQEVEIAHSEVALRQRSLIDEELQFKRKNADDLGVDNWVVQSELNLLSRQVRLNEAKLNRYTRMLHARDLQQGIIPAFRVDSPYEFSEKRSQPRYLVFGLYAFFIPIFAFAFAWGVERWHVRNLIRNR